MIFIFNECNYRKLDQCYELAHLWSSVGGFHLYLDCLREMRFSYHAPQLLCSCQTWDGIVDCFELLCLWLSHWNFHKILVPEKRKHANHVMNCILVNCNRNLQFSCISYSGLDARHFPAKFTSYLQHNSEKRHDQIEIDTAENNCSGSYKQIEGNYWHRWVLLCCVVQWNNEFRFIVYGIFKWVILPPYWATSIYGAFSLNCDSYKLCEVKPLKETSTPSIGVCWGNNCAIQLRKKFVISSLINMKCMNCIFYIWYLLETRCLLDSTDQRKK